jgi:protein TonB
MFNQLLESKAKKQKLAGGTLFSMILHGVLGAAAVAATAGAGIANDEKKAEKIQFVEMKKEAPKPKPEPPPPPPPKDVVVAPPIAKGFQVLRAPVEIPIKIPDIDLSKKVTDESDFTGKGVKGGSGKGVEGGVPQIIDQNTTYFEFQVEKPVSQVPGTGAPRYPDALRSSGVEGEVQAQFVVSEEGRCQHVQGAQGNE